MKPDLILAASAGLARFFTRASADEPLVPLDTLHFEPQGSQPGRPHADRPARIEGRAGLAPRMDPKRKQHIEFARRVSVRIDEILATGCGRLIVFAAQPFAGVLEAELSDTARKALHAAVDIDLTHFGVAQLQQRGDAALGAAHSPGR